MSCSDNATNFDYLAAKWNCYKILPPALQNLNNKKVPGLYASVKMDELNHEFSVLVTFSTI